MGLGTLILIILGIIVYIYGIIQFYRTVKYWNKLTDKVAYDDFMLGGFSLVFTIIFFIIFCIEYLNQYHL